MYGIHFQDRPSFWEHVRRVVILTYNRLVVRVLTLDQLRQVAWNAETNSTPGQSEMARDIAAYLAKREIARRMA